MQFDGREGNSVRLWLVGYQFPDDDDPRVRFSWHQVGGHVTDAAGEWSFVDPALACDESVRLSSWLRELATAGIDDLIHRSRIAFTEPNLSFDAATSDDGTISLKVGFDLESRPPWDRRVGAGDPYVVPLTVDSEQIDRAVHAWDEDLGLYPDGLA